MGIFGGSNDAVTKIRVNYDGKDAERGLRALKGSMDAVFGTIGAKMVLNYTNELAKLGMQSEVVAKNFNNFAKARNRDTNDMMTQLRKSTMGMVDDMQLQQKAMRAMIGGVKYDDMITAMEYVTKYAAATGQDVNIKMQSVMTGFARKSALFLDDVGIQVMGAKDVVGAAVDQMKAKMGQFATSENDAFVKAGQLNAELENQKVLLGRDLQPIYSATLSFLQGMAKASKALTENTSLYAQILGTLHGGGNLEDVRIMRSIKSAEEMENKEAALIYLTGLRNKKQEESLAIARKMGILIKENGDVVKTEKEYLKLKEQLSDVNRQDLEYEGALNRLRKKKDITGTPIEPTATGGDDTGGRESRKKLQEMIAEDELNARKMGLEDLKEATGKYLEEEEYAYQQALDKRLNLQKNVDSIEDELLKQSAEGRKQLLYRDYLEKYMVLDEAGRSTVKLEEWVQTEMTRIDEEEAQKRIEAHSKEQREKIAAANQFISLQASLVSGLTALSDTYTQKELGNLDKKKMGEKQYNKEKERIEKEATERNKVFARMQQGIVIARAISDVYAASISSAKDTFGGPILKGLSMASMVGMGMLQVAQIQAQHFQRGMLGEADRLRKPDDINAMIGSNEAVVPGPQYAMHEEDVRAIVNNTANTASGLRKLKGGGVVNNFYGLSETQVADVMRDQERRNYTGRLI